MTYDEIMKKITTLRLKSAHIAQHISVGNFKWILSRDVLHTIESNLFNVVAYRNLVYKKTLEGYPIEVYEGREKDIIRLIWEVK